MRLPLAPALALCLAPAALADTLTVGPTGSGADFDDIPAAVAAAQPGDTVLVAPGEYASTSTIVVDKPLTLLGSGSDVTSYEALISSPFDIPLPLAVTGIPAGQSVRVAGLTLRSGTFGGTIAAGFVVEDCDGPVALVDLVSSGFPQELQSGAVASCAVRHSAQVILQDCSVAVFASFGVEPIGALHVDGSTVFLVDSFLLGGSSGPAFSMEPVFDGSPGLVATGSTVRLARTRVRGGDGATDGVFGSPGTLTVGGPAVDAAGSTIAVRGGATNRLRGGDGGVATIQGVESFGLGGPALQLAVDASATSTADALLLPGVDGLPGTAPVVAGPGDYLALDDALATLGVSNPIVAPGGTASLELGGEPGATALTFAALFEVPASTLPGFLGPIVLPQGAALTLAPRVLDAAGAATLGVPIPGGPTLVGFTPILQTVVIDGATVSVSGPTLVAIR